jgi:hypothetical protein
MYRMQDCQNKIAKTKRRFFRACVISNATDTEKGERVV